MTEYHPTRVSPHFLWREVMVSCHLDRAPLSSEEQRAATCLAGQLEDVRAALGAPIRVSSWLRRTMDNDRVGGVPRSRHRVALAADLVPCCGRTLADLTRAARRVGGWREIIVEPGWLHVAL